MHKSINFIILQCTYFVPRCFCLNFFFVIIILSSPFTLQIGVTITFTFIVFYTVVIISGEVDIIIPISQTRKQKPRDFQ